MTFFGEIGASFVVWGILIIIGVICWYGRNGKYHSGGTNWAAIFVGGVLLVIFGCWGLSWVEVQLRPLFGGYMGDATIVAADLLVITILGGITAHLWQKGNRQWTPPARVLAAILLSWITHAIASILFRSVTYGFCVAEMVGVIAAFFCSKRFRDRIARWREDRAASQAITTDTNPEEESPETGGDATGIPKSEPIEIPFEKAETVNQGHFQDVAFWHAVVEVTMGPAMLVAEPSAYPPGRLPVEGQSWLAEYQRGRACGLRLVVKRGAKLEFFARCDSKGEAIEVANTMLGELKHRFRGLHGEAFARAITRPNLSPGHGKPYCELALPAPPYTTRVALLEKLVDIGRDIPDGIECIIMWHPLSWWESNGLEKRLVKGQVPKGLDPLLGALVRRATGTELPRDLFMARIFVTAQKSSRGSFDALVGHLHSLRIAIMNDKREDATWRVAPAGTHLNILKCHFGGGYPIAPSWGRFDFPDNLKLPRGFLLVGENFHAVTDLRQDNPSYIILGNALVDGAPTRYLGYVATHHLPMSGVILGSSGTGKSTCLGHIVRQVVTKCPKVGILVINVGKAGEERHFPFAKVIRWDDADFGIPWFVRGPKYGTACERFADILSATLGLKRPLPYVVQNALAWDETDPAQDDPSPCTEVPPTFHAFVRKLRAYLKANPYAPDTQADITRMIDNRVARLDRPDFDAMTRLDRPGRFGWFREWLEGHHVYLDLVGAPLFLMKFITFTIFQMIRETAPQAEGMLCNLLVIDEAHVLFPRPTSTDPDEEEVIGANFMEKLLGDYLDEFRSRGHALLLSNQEPANLLAAAYEKPALKIAFHLPATSAAMLLPVSPDRAIVQRLPEHHALVIDGATGQFFCIRARPPPKGAELAPERVEEGRARSLQENLDRIEGKRGVLDPGNVPEETVAPGTPHAGPDQSLDDLEQELAARLGRTPRQASSSPSIPRLTTVYAGNQQETALSPPHKKEIPPSLAVIPPQNDYLTLIRALEAHERAILRNPYFLHPLLASVYGQNYLEGRAQMLWNERHPHEAYYLMFARYNNHAHTILQARGKELVIGRSPTAVHNEILALAPQGQPRGKSLCKAIAQLRVTHKQILHASSVDLGTFRQAIGALKWVTHQLVTWTTRGNVSPIQGQQKPSTASGGA